MLPIMLRNTSVQSRARDDEDRALALRKKERKLSFEGLQDTVLCEILSQKEWLFLEYDIESVAAEIFYVKLCSIHGIVSFNSLACDFLVYLKSFPVHVSSKTSVK